MDPVTVLTVIQTALTLGTQIWTYISTFKDASKERQNHLNEVKLVVSTLKFLNRRVQEINRGDPWSEGLLTLLEPGQRFAAAEGSNDDNTAKPTVVDRMGRKMHLDRWKKKPEPKGTSYYDTNAYEDGVTLKRLKDLLEGLSKKLTKGDNIREIGNKLVWSWQKPGVADSINEIARLTDHISKVLQQDQFDLSLADHILAKDTNQRMRAVERTQDQEIRERERKEIMTWLSPLEYYKRQDSVFRDSFPAEQRLVNSPEFRAWVNGRDWILRCHGKPGAGKTVLCSEVIHYLERTFPKKMSEDCLVLYLYLDYKEKEAQTLVNLKGSLVKQLVQHQEFNFRSKALPKMWRASRGEARPQDEELVSVLKEEFRVYSRVFLIIDGWDDASANTREGLDDLLSDLKAHNVSVMIISRSAEIDTADNNAICNICGTGPLSIYFVCPNRDCPDFAMCQNCKDEGQSCGNASHGELYEPNDQVYFWIEATDDEIRRYVTWEMEQQTQHDKKRRIDTRLKQSSFSARPLSRRLKEEPLLLEKIPNEIVRKAKGMYLLARLYIDSLKTMQSVAEIERELVKLPDDLDAVYEEKMNSVVTQKPARLADWAKRTLHWIVCAQRPLSFAELQHALGVHLGDMRYDPDETTQEADIIACTRGLINIDASDKHTLRIHLTLDEYLYRTQKKWFPGASLDVATTLLTYLNFNELEQPCSDDSDHEIQIRLSNLSLLAYAAQYWSHHVAEHRSDEKLRPLLLEFLGNAGKVTSCVQAEVFVNPTLIVDLDVRKGVTGLHLAALHGLDELIPDLVQRAGVDIDSLDDYDQTALMYACRKGRLTTVKELLNLGASVNVVSKRENTAFFEAYRQEVEDGEEENSHRRVAKFLLEKEELDVNRAFIEVQNATPLVMAIRRGDDEIAEILLRKPRISVSLQDSNGHTALSAAVLQKLENIVELLLKMPDVDVNTLDNMGRSPLTIAARYGTERIVDLLLNKGADATIRDRDGGGTPLQRAIDQGNVGIIRVLLKHEDVKIDTVDDRGRGFLHSASINGREEIVLLLLQAGLSPNVAGHRGETPLHDASRADHFAVAEALLKWKADRTLTDRFGRTPREVAWENGQFRTMRLVGGADASADDPSTGPIPDVTSLPTWSLAKLGLIDTITARLGRGLETLEQKDPDSGDTPLHYAVLASHYPILALLLSAHVSPNPTNDLGRTPLHLAIYRSDLPAIDSLILHNADLTLQDTWHQTPLVLAQNLEKYDIAVMLLVGGAQIDPAQRSYLQPTFTAAVAMGKALVVEYLIAKGADHLRPDMDGFTARQIALANEDQEMLAVLKRHRSEYFPLRTDKERESDRDLRSQVKGQEGIEGEALPSSTAFVDENGMGLDLKTVALRSRPLLAR